MKSGNSVFLSLVVCAALLLIFGLHASAQAVGADRVVEPAGLPQVRYVTPNNGSGVAAEFHFGYRHEDTADAFANLRFIFVANNRDDPSGLYFNVSPASGQVHVGNGGRFGGTLQYGRLGEARTIVNEFASVDLSRARVERIGSREYELIVHLNFINSTWNDRQVNIILFASDLQFNETEYAQLGIWRVDKPAGTHSPENMSISPRNGSGRTETFRCVAKDEDGADDIEYFELTLGNDGASWQNTLFIAVYPATNRYRLYAFGDNREGTIGVTNLRNDWVRVVSTSLAKGREDKYLYFTVRLAFSPRFIGEYGVYLYARDRTHREDGDRMTRYTVTRSTYTPRGLFTLPANPVASSINSPGLPIPVDFYGLWTDLDGTDDIDTLEMKIASAPGEGSNVAIFRFDPNEEMVDLLASDSSADNIPVRIGSSLDLDVGTAKLEADSVQVATLGRTQFGIRFHAYFYDTMLGEKSIYMRGTDYSGNRGPWRRVGSITINRGNSAARPVSVTPVWSDGTSGSISVKCRDADGANDIESVEVIINEGASAVPAGGIRLIFNNRTRALTIQQEGSSASGSIDNPHLDLGFSRAVVDFARSWAFHEGSYVNLLVRLTFDVEEFSGVKTIWVRCTDTRGRTSRWRALGGFFIR